MKICFGFTFLFIFVVFTRSVVANEISECQVWQVKASEYMNARQQNTPIADAMKQVMGNRSRGLLLRAYAYPIEDDFVAKTKVISEFSQTVFEECQSSP